MSLNTLLTSRAVIAEIYNRLTLGDSSWVNRYAMKVDSRQQTENYAWLGMVPQMREWVGGRLAKGLRESTFSITNKDYEATLEVLVKELRRDAGGQLRIRIAELARRVLSHPAALMSTKIIAGESSACYDGQFFFDTDHSEGDSGTQDNDRTGAAATGTTPTVQEMRDAIMTCLQAILGFKDDQGEPMNENARAFEIMVPTVYWGVAQSAVGLGILGGGEVNILPNLPEMNLTVVPNPRLTWTDKFAVFRTDGDTKPFILQEEVPVAVSAIAEGSELEFKEKKHWYGVEWGGAVDYGFWQHACLYTFT